MVSSSAAFPCSRPIAARASIGSRSRSTPATRIPAANRPRVIALPMPPAAPVTIATLWLSVIACFLHSVGPHLLQNCGEDAGDGVSKANRLVTWGHRMAGRTVRRSIQRLVGAISEPRALSPPFRLRLMSAPDVIHHSCPEPGGRNDGWRACAHDCRRLHGGSDL